MHHINKLKNLHDHINRYRRETITKSNTIHNGNNYKPEIEEGEIFRFGKEHH